MSANITFLEDNKFLQLIQVSLGTRSASDFRLTEPEFLYCFNEAKRQTLLGVLLDSAANALDAPDCSDLSVDAKFQWIAHVLEIENSNRLLISRAGELTRGFSDVGLDSCILKGSSVAGYYPNPLFRQSGDIDIWVDGDRSEIIKLMSESGPVGKIFYHHLDLDLFDDAHVEVHLYPTWFNNPFVNRRFHKWLNFIKPNLFIDRHNSGFNSPSIVFDLVFSLIHIYRHIFDGGIGLRQLMDYYYILTHSTQEQRQTALKVISEFKMADFCAGIMYVLQSDFLMDSQYCLTSPSAKYGEPINHQIFIGGNFGKGDKRNQTRHSSLGKSLLWTIKQNATLLRYYPSETLWSIPFKAWQWVMIRIWNRKR